LSAWVLSACAHFLLDAICLENMNFQLFKDIAVCAKPPTLPTQQPCRILAAC
jgi:hypothetical protein